MPMCASMYVCMHLFPYNMYDGSEKCNESAGSGMQWFVPVDGLRGRQTAPLGTVESTPLQRHHQGECTRWCCRKELETIAPEALSLGHGAPMRDR